MRDAEELRGIAPGQSESPGQVGGRVAEGIRRLAPGTGAPLASGPHLRETILGARGETDVEPELGSVGVVDPERERLAEPPPGLLERAPVGVARALVRLVT
jgi:hypothetical protein